MVWGGEWVGLPVGKLTTNATLSTFQLSPPIPPPNCVEIVTPVMSSTLGAGLGSVRIAA
jgi:hypothetical protein